jgi:hypothetical protein
LTCDWALQLWRENEQRWNVKLFFRTGALWMAGKDDSYKRAAMPLMKEAGVRFEKLSSADCSKRWPTDVGPQRRKHVTR